MAVKFKRNAAGIKQLLRSEIARKAVEAPARRVESAAKANAPVVTGTLRDAISMRVETHNRVVAIVNANTEYGGTVAATNHWLANALDAAQQR